MRSESRSATGMWLVGLVTTVVVAVVAGAPVMMLMIPSERTTKCEKQYPMGH
jgi:hypothetical protein